jgi:hypothetical protein
MEKNFTPEQIEQIIKIALANKTNKVTDNKINIYEIAKELNIDESVLNDAIKQFESNAEINKIRETYIKNKKKKFYEHLLYYIFVNSILIGINIFSDGSLNWSLITLLAWGFGLAINAYNAFSFNEEDFQRFYKKILRRQKGQKFNELIDLGLNKAIDVIKQFDINELKGKDNKFGKK